MISLILFVIFLTGLTLWKAARHERRAEASHPPIGQFLEIDGHRVHAVVMGQGPDVVLIHGASGNVRDMTFSLAPRLAERYRVIVIDRPGLGYTDRINRSGATITQQAELLMKTARTLGADKPIVMGQSYGGAVALAWAVNHPDSISALVPLAAASNPWNTPLDRYYKVLSHRWIGPIAIPILTAWVPDERVSRAVASVFEPQAEPEGYDAYFGTGLTLRRKSLRANAMQRANLKQEIINQHTRYGEISVPTEIVHGDADTTVSIRIHSEPLVQQIPGAVLTRLPGIGHMPQHVAQDEVVAAIDRAAARAGLN